MVERCHDIQDLLAEAQAGNRHATARLLSIAEAGGADARRLSRQLPVDLGDTRVAGITGAPGAGKSTLTNACIAEFRSRSLSVAVLAVDPSSPLSGGAILGDRLRMTSNVRDERVLIRSMANRGAMGGLALSVPLAVRLLACLGWQWILVETVGVGQSECDILGISDTCAVVVNPGWGDTIQANKAGLMEIADLFVINKADRPGLADTKRDLQNLIEDSRYEGRRPDIVETIATDAHGIDMFCDSLVAHIQHLESKGLLAARRRNRLADEIVKTARETLIAQLEDVAKQEENKRLFASVGNGTADISTASDGLISALLSRYSNAW